MSGWTRRRFLRTHRVASSILSRGYQLGWVIWLHLIVSPFFELFAIGFKDENRVGCSNSVGRVCDRIEEQSLIQFHPISFRHHLQYEFSIQASGASMALFASSAAPLAAAKVGSMKAP
jgi:hypothetical protein